MALAGCGIKGGAVVGKTNANGTAVTDREVNGGHLFHTYLQAVGLEPDEELLPERPARSRSPTRRPTRSPRCWRDRRSVLGRSRRSPTSGYPRLHNSRSAIPMPADRPHAARVEREFKHARPLIGCRFDPTGRFLFASAEDNTIQRFDLLTGTKTALAGHASWVRGHGVRRRHATFAADAVAAVERGCAGVPGGGVGAGGRRPRRSRTRSRSSPATTTASSSGGRATPTTPKPLRSVAAHDGWVRAVAVSPDGKTVATCGNDHLVKLWSAADGAPLRTLDGHDCHVYNVAFHPDGTRLVSADLKGVVKDWDLKTGSVRPRPRREGAAQVRPGVPGRHRRRSRAWRSTPTARSWRAAASRTCRTPSPASATRWWCCSTGRTASRSSSSRRTRSRGRRGAWRSTRPGSSIAAGGGSGGRVWFWKGDETASVHASTCRRTARDLALHPAGDRFAVALANGVVQVYTLVPPPAKGRGKFIAV